MEITTSRLTYVWRLRGWDVNGILLLMQESELELLYDCFIILFICHFIML